jgi:hypothetical protein
VEGIEDLQDGNVLMELASFVENGTDIPNASTSDSSIG